MECEILESKKRMAAKMDFTFMGDNAENEAGHIANMVNQVFLPVHYINYVLSFLKCACLQLRMILFDVRTEALAYQSSHGVSQLRKCPHCGLIWTKIEGCDGATRCGERPSIGFDVRDPNYGILATFTFKVTRGKLNIFKSGSKKLKVWIYHAINLNVDDSLGQRRQGLIITHLLYEYTLLSFN